MVRREPLRQVDLALLTLYGFFLFVGFLWLGAAGVALRTEPGEIPAIDWLVRSLPPFLVIAQSVFFLAATQFRAFRQRLMTLDATPRDAVVGAVVLWVAAVSFHVFLVA